MTTLITGADGFIGRHLVKRVLQEEDQVRVLMRRQSSASYLSDRRVEVFNGDLAIKESLRDIVKDVAVVINAAGVLGKWGVSPKVLFEANILGLKHLLEACLASNIHHFIHLSSSGVSGPLGRDGADENHPCNPSSPYEKSKYQGEKLALEMAARYKIPLTIIRPTFTYGPGDLHHLPLFRLIKKGGFIYLGDGQASIHPVFVDDLIEGVMLCKAPRPSSEIYIIGGEKIFTIQEMVSSLAQLLGVKQPHWHLPLLAARLSALAFESAAKVLHFEPPLTRSRLALFTQHYGYSIAKAKEELGYQPKTKLCQGLQQTIHWYREQGHL